MERTIKVTGNGKLKVKPDTIRLIMKLEGMKNEYGDAVKLSSDMTDDIKVLFEGLGFKKSDVKTLYFNVSAEYENYQSRDNSWKRRFEGYKFVHRFKLEFPADNQTLGKVLYALGHAPVCPEFSIEYTVSNPEQSKNELLGKAVADSMEKAKVLSQAAGVALGDIITIDYSWGEIDFVSRPMNNMLLAKSCEEIGAGYDIDIEPDDIDVSDSVTVVWQIQGCVQ